MSVNYSAYVMYGGLFNAEDLRDTEQRRGCAHPCLDAKFCPECGKPMWHTVDLGERIDSVYRIGDMGYVSKMWDNQPKLVVGVVLSKVDDYNINSESWSMVDSPNDNIKDRLKVWCEEHGIDMPNPTTFLVMYAG